MSKSQDYSPKAWSDWDAEAVGFECQPNVGLTVTDDTPPGDHGSRWFSWEETVALHEWLGGKIWEASGGFRHASESFVATHTASPEAALNCLVSLGINYPDGTLTPEYGGEDEIKEADDGPA